MTRTLNGYIARETEAAVAFVQLPLNEIKKPLWLPRKKIAAIRERDDYAPSVQLAGENIRRLAIPVELDADAAFLDKVGA